MQIQYTIFVEVLDSRYKLDIWFRQNFRLLKVRYSHVGLYTALYIHCRNYHIDFFISDPLSAICPDISAIYRELISGPRIDHGSDMIMKKPMVQSFYMYLAQVNISRYWWITMWYRLRKVSERYMKYSRTVWYIFYISLLR